MSESTAPFESWAIVELMGHVRMAGRVTEEERFGAKLGRIDIPKDDPAGVGFSTVYFGGGSVYRLTPCTEEVARSVARRNQPEPIHRWELPGPPKEPAQDAEYAHSDDSEDMHDQEEPG